MTDSAPTRISVPRLALALALCLLALAGTAAAAAPRVAKAPKRPARVPQGFFGTVVGGPLFPGLAAGTPGSSGQAGTSPFQNQMNLMVSSGVESVRVVFDWAAAQPYRSWSQVPADEQSEFSSDGVDNVPTNFTDLDALMAAASTRRLSVLPVILNAPGWDGHTYPGAGLAIPTRDAPYAQFAAALVKRYGPDGTFWQGQSPKVPVTEWQVWNEPDVAAFWGQRPFAARYVALLKAARAAIRHEDPHAKIVLAGLANYSWKDLRSIYAIKGARSLFDIVGLHPYTRTPQGVITILKYGRQVMASYGDAKKPMMADEISWPSSLGKTTHSTGYDFATTEAGQAKDVSAVLPLLAANRSKLGLIAVYYYTWAEVEQPNGLAFSYSGLLKYQHSEFVKKPVFYAYRHNVLDLERCHEKAAVATTCLKPF